MVDATAARGEGDIRVDEAARGPVVVVAGASGYVGQALGARLGGDGADLIGLSRRAPEDLEGKPGAEHYRWRRCDLFSRRSCMSALAGADLAIYLVHDVQPTAALTQGDQRDLDVICADNFARAAAAHGVRQIVYLSALMPDEYEPSQGPLASHLEVEQVLGAHGVPVMTLRAGPIVGPGSPVANLLRQIIERLPVLLCPDWTRAPIHPVSLDDVVAVIAHCLGDRSLDGATFEVGGPEVLTFRDMLRVAAQVLDHRRLVLPLPLFSPRGSSLLLWLASGEARNRVRPLIDRIASGALGRDAALLRAAGAPDLPFTEALFDALCHPRPEARPLPVTTEAVARANDVRSIQRIPLPQGRDADWLVRHWAGWLPQNFFPWLVRGSQEDDGGQVRFFLKILPWPILELSLDRVVSTPDRRLYWITGGLLAEPAEGARFEFREILGQRYVLAAIHDFDPRLPWRLYLATQARVHAWVMERYRRYMLMTREFLRQHPEDTLLSTDQATPLLIGGK